MHKHYDNVFQCRQSMFIFFCPFVCECVAFFSLYSSGEAFSFACFPINFLKPFEIVLYYIPSNDKQLQQHQKQQQHTKHMTRKMELSTNRLRSMKRCSMCQFFSYSLLSRLFSIRFVTVRWFVCLFTLFMLTESNGIMFYCHAAV